ncbi:hypothetical protein ANOM_005935 [Aspergillus nomiae NRRL 13137]|uniref:Heterokaryon incompatibility domain-containing protein n=1 Tax=Aspergillus nomiae NRRL (strain ATCC 15546 / NRRL 13137 / CBS 260.88 / M93) TaxID=1509407 RepID=A0A0L1J3B7_ASPN3|nr:uncharacterized protein ANOM_005935 [Aspergillus nomiae NRRL 13137]KNG86301.1 hypothetical protein ANOM_005935 [Aspergillus nomiae NRRL 13137]
MGDDALAALISEAKQISRADSLQRISAIFQCIDHLLSLEDSKCGYEAVGILRTFPIFPTRRGEARPTLQTCERHDGWFIADQPRLLETFHGHLTMLAFGAEDLARMSRLFRALLIEDRLLSKAAICRPRQGLASVVKDDYKSLLLSKAECISCLARNHLSQPSEISKLLRDIEVRSVDEVTVEWAVLHPSGYIIDTHEDIKLALIVREENSVRLYIRHSDADAQNLPFELCEQLSQLCGIPFEHRSLLWAALLLNDIQLLHDALGRGGIFRAMSRFSTYMYADQLSCRNDSSSREDEITQVTQSNAIRDDISLISKSSEDSEIPTAMNSSLPSMSRSEEQVTGSNKKVSFIEQWQQISVFPEADGHRTQVSFAQCEWVHPSETGHTQLDDRDNMSIAQLTDSYYQHRVPRFTPQPDIIFCSTVEELPEVDFEGITQGQKTLPARLQILDPGGQTVFIARNSNNPTDHEPAFLGEVFVSEFLRHVLGSAYDPDIHWTSPLRTRLGHAPFTVQDNFPMSGFYIDAQTGQAMTDFLKANSVKRAAEWAYLPPDYRIDVQTTVDGASAPFSWSALDLDMARRWRVRGSSEQQDRIYILIRVSDIYNNPSVHMFMDPWDMISEQELLIRTQSNVLANIHDGSRRGIKLTDFQSNKPQERDDTVSRKSRPFVSAIPHLYIQSPLDEAAKEIRLLYLLPGRGDEDLTGELIHSAIAGRPEYDAISYTWGSAIQPFKLHTPEGYIPITTSLYLALMRMRKCQEPRMLWVDAICINQNDNVEKASQISMMPDIFRWATCVYAWIGEDEDGSLEVLNTINEIARQSLELTMPPRSGDDLIPPIVRTFWNNLCKLLERKWFRRIWVVQEIVLARDVIVWCGDQCVPWGHFCDIVSRLFQHAEQYSSDLLISRGSSAGSVLRLDKLRKDCWVSGEFEAKYQLLSLFEHFQLNEATQRRDKLFALLNLASDNCEELRPDYTAPLEDIIWRYACTFVKNGHMMELLYRSGRSSDHTFPSWVPDWTSAPYPRTLSKWKCKRKPHRFTAASKFHLSGELGPGKLLCLRGYLVDHVSRVGTRPSYTSSFPAYRQEISAMVDEFLPNLTPQQTTAVKQRLPIGDFDMDSEEAHALSERIDYLNDIWAAESQAYNAIASRFADIFSPAVACGTDMQKVGIVPANTHEGDRIALFHGSRVPFIIRETDPLDGHYRVIGECYIDGLMHGEYMDLSGPWRDIKLV